MDDIGLTNHETTGTPGEDTSHPVKGGRAEVNVFFDGTGNNFYNVNAAQKLSGEASYENALSNIARMSGSLDIDSKVIALYVEGIGTTRYEEDKFTGMALGEGETGIDERVKDAFPKLVDLVGKKRGVRGLPAIMDINVFGFSRGAAAARYFVHLVNTKKEPFGPDWNEIEIHCNFVGLFDTVASYGVKHSDDVQQLHLNFEANYAVKVFHLIAGDEYRENFPVSTIASAKKLKVEANGDSVSMGYELRIPGAHSDVGGGYNDAEHESRKLYPSIKDFVYNQGWYDANLQTSAIWHTHEREVLAEYYKIGLALMVDQTHLHSTTRFPSKLLKPSEDADIQNLQSTLREFAKDEKNTTWDLTEKLGAEKARALRKRFMHQSFSTFPMNPRLNENGIPNREYMAG